MSTRPGHSSAAGFLGDVRHAVRTLARSPGFTVATLVSLAAGFALAACALAIANAYLARSFPFPDVERLYHVMYAPPGPVEPRGMSAIDWDAASEWCPTYPFGGGSLATRSSMAADAAARASVGMAFRTMM